jgi:hypothetical protein
LAGHELLPVDKLAEAKSALEIGGIKLVFVGARFDESRMFELLEFMRQDVEHQKIPIVAGIVVPTTMSAETIAGLGHATKLLGASVFVNLNDFPDDDANNMRLRLLVDALIIPVDIIPKLQHSVGA